MENLMDERKKELLALGKEMTRRRKVIVEKWKAERPNMVRGECNTIEMRALEQEAKIRYGEILKKYENLSSKD